MTSARFLSPVADIGRAVVIGRDLALRRGATGTFRLRPGTDRSFLAAKDLGVRFAMPEINVLLTGETGTGKDVFARMIHDASKRSLGPFLPVDCSVLPGELVESELFGHEKGAFTGAVTARIGRFESAQGGTLFLDEIGNLPLGVQAKLLRVLQERRISRLGSTETIRLDVRLVSATNVDLEDAVERGAFRRDLYFRLNEASIPLPPLRDRPGDVELLALHFAEASARRLGRPAPALTEEALQSLASYGWPGNVRELENAMKAAVVLADTKIKPEHLPSGLQNGRVASAAKARSAARSIAAGPAGRDTGKRATIAVPPTRGSTRPAPTETPGVLHVELDIPLDETGMDLKAVAARAAEEAERALLRELLSQGDRNLARLSRLLDVDPKTLRARLRKYGL